MDLVTLGYWLFSALAQSMAALFAVVGVFLVFRIQILNERMRQLMEVAKFTYLNLMKISKITQQEKYLEVTVYTPKEMVARLIELIKEKKKRLESNKETLWVARADGKDTRIFEDNIKELESDISNCEKSSMPLQLIGLRSLYIQDKGKGFLIEACFVFIVSLIFLFLTPFIPQHLIFIFALVIVSVAILVIIDTVRIIIKSLDIGGDWEEINE